MTGEYENDKPFETTSQAFDPAEWLGHKNARWLIRMNRAIMLETVRQQLDEVKPLLAGHGGIAYFETYANDTAYRILITNFFHLAGERNTVISANAQRNTLPSEPFAIDGQAIDLFDIVIPDHSRWLNSCWETLYRNQHQHRWPQPERATLIEPHTNSVRLCGNLARGEFLPAPANDLEDITTDGEMLWRAHFVLGLCSSASFEPSITQIT